MNTLLLIRGLPGSGKTSLARKLETHYIHCETDKFWGIDYNFDITKIKEAHEWCQKKVREELENGFSVVVSNTFTTQKEMQPYFDMAKELNASVQVVLCQGNFGSVHNVPQEALDRMKARFEYEIKF
jgi:predicted kinase